MASTEKTVRLIAAVRQIKGGRLLLPGDEFDANEREAKNFVRMHFATLKDEEVVRSTRRSYKRRDMEAETVVNSVSLPVEE
jgi:hypothetical protein